jgi:ER degradation enhancer, mannosidase alpha-like 2
LIDAQLSFDRDVYVKNFEITIRMLGGLLSAYQLSGDGRLLALARDLGHRLLPAFNSPTGLPYEYVNLRSGKVRGTRTNPAETGSLLLEFGTISMRQSGRWLRPTGAVPPSGSWASRSTSRPADGPAPIPT